MGEPLAKSLGKEISDREIAIEVAKFLDSKRAEEVVVLDVSRLLPITSYFVLCTGSSSRTLEALTDEIDRLLRTSSLAKLGKESDSESRWICLDYSDVVVHLFTREARGFYDLDHLWGDSPRVDFPSAESQLE